MFKLLATSFWLVTWANSTKCSINLHSITVNVTLDLTDCLFELLLLLPIAITLSWADYIWWSFQLFKFNTQNKVFFALRDFPSELIMSNFTEMRYHRSLSHTAFDSIIFISVNQIVFCKWENQQIECIKFQQGIFFSAFPNICITLVAMCKANISRVFRQHLTHH